MPNVRKMMPMHPFEAQKRTGNAFFARFFGPVPHAHADEERDEHQNDQVGGDP